MTRTTQQCGGYDAPSHIQSRDFPPLISRALARIAGRVGEVGELSRDARALLAEYVRCVDCANPRNSVRLSNEHLAHALQVSVRTLLRIKNELVEGGWITRHQIKSRADGMQISDVVLTSFCICQLGFNSEARVGQDRRKLVIPDTLAWLSILGLSDGAIVSLLGIAKKHKKDLNQIANCLIEKLSIARHPYAYLKKCLINWTPNQLRVDNNPQLLHKPLESTGNNNYSIKQIFYSRKIKEFLLSSPGQKIIVGRSEIFLEKATDQIYSIGNDGARRVVAVFEGLYQKLFGTNECQGLPHSVGQNCTTPYMNSYK